MIRVSCAISPENTTPLTQFASRQAGNLPEPEDTWHTPFRAMCEETLAHCGRTESRGSPGAHTDGEAWRTQNVCGDFASSMTLLPTVCRTSTAHKEGGCRGSRAVRRHPVGACWLIASMALLLQFCVWPPMPRAVCPCSIHLPIVCKKAVHPDRRRADIRHSMCGRRIKRAL